jgi:p38 MAP kinase
MFHVAHLLARVACRLPDEKEFSSFICNGSKWVLPMRYRDPELIGCGTFGQVCSAMDTLTKKLVVVKRLYRPFETQVHSRRTHRELILLSRMNHENVVGLLDAYTPDVCAQSLNEVYLVTDHMSCTLQQFIDAHPIISTDTIRLFVYQIFRGLKYIHSVGVIHRVSGCN